MDQAAGDDILFELRDGIGRVTFNRPQARNAFTFAMYERLAQICEQANHDRAIKVLVLQGAGDKAFASGTDINQFRAFTTPQHALDYEARIDRVCEVRAALETIAARGAVATYRAEPERLHRLDAVLARMDEAARRGDWAAVNKADLEFHHEICLASKNDIVITLWQGLARHLLMIFGREILTETGRSQIVQQHRDFITQLLASDAAGLPPLVEHHIMRLRRPLR